MFIVFGGEIVGIGSVFNCYKFLGLKLVFDSVVDCGVVGLFELVFDYDICFV